MTCIHAYVISASFQAVIKGLEKQLWSALTARTGMFTNGPAANHHSEFVFTSLLWG